MDSRAAPIRDASSQDIVKALKALMIEHSLPLWAGEGWDPRHGGFVERLDRDGRPDLAVARRVRVQARQIYCFAKAAQIGWYPAGREIALQGLEYLLQKAKSPDGQPGFVHALAPDGAVLNPRRDTYDHAFVLLALTSIYGLSRDSQIRAEIDSLLTVLDTHLRSPHGGFLEGWPPSMPRRQNPHMHLFESMIAAFDTTHDAGFLRRAEELFGLFVSKFYDNQKHVLGEYFEDDWSKIDPVCVEPGHQAEWIWLLMGFERIAGSPTGRYRSELLASALRYCDGITGCLVDEGDADGNVKSHLRRCWPQTEIAKAWTAQAEAAEPGAADEARIALTRLRRYYLQHPVRGGWYDQFDREDRSVVDFIPASSFYHVLIATTEAERVLG